MSDDKGLNKFGNHQGEFTQSVGGWAEYTVVMTEIKDRVRHDVRVPPGKVIPVIFLPGVMGSNLRMSAARQKYLKTEDNRAWRPDDISSSGVVLGAGLGGWFKNATPWQRQLIFDPNETEVDYYSYTENKQRFDPNGALTKASDARHQNVPNGLAPIPPLIGNAPGSKQAPPTDANGKPRPLASAAQIARWRGWSEVLFKGAYGTMLQTVKHYLNNIVRDGAVSPSWRPGPKNSQDKPELTAQHAALSQLLMSDPKNFGATAGTPITEAELKTIAPCWYPVHAMGYNFIKSNGESAVVIADRIRGLVAGYRKRGFKCDEVIILTHSMGGLLGRALVHPKYGNMLNDASVKILGIYHNVMPTMGAAGAYKRMRFGFQEKEGMAAEYEAQVLAFDGEHATAILANAPAPLEMMPGAAYGLDWLKVVDGKDKLLWSWPRGSGTALADIYLKPAKAWWRLINPDWVNPGRIRKADGGGVENVHQRLKDATQFLSSIETTFHPVTYASYCASSEHASYGDVVFKVIASLGSELDSAGRVIPWPAPETWVLLTDNKKDTLTVQAGHRVLTLKLQPGIAAGDETVPSARSAQHIKGTLFEHGKTQGKGYEHQKSYADPQVLASLLYSVVQIAKTAKWT
ncbi:MAG: hypothetical protein V4754_10680 [Pseudomonadota bacterium]